MPVDPDSGDPMIEMGGLCLHPCTIVEIMFLVQRGVHFHFLADGSLRLHDPANRLSATGVWMLEQASTEVRAIIDWLRADETVH